MQFSIPTFLACTLTSIPAILGAITINNPIDGTVWRVGERETITWIPKDGGFDTTASWPVAVMYGNQSNMAMAGVIGQVKEADASFSFVVPTSWGNSKEYAVRIGNTYSHYFTIEGSNKDAPNPTSTTASSSSSTPTSTSTSTSSATDANSQGAANMSPHGPSAGSVIAFVPFALLALSWIG
ncbi:MAG: hypothetical protein DHS80DRAFT_31975 [Piptocephalis tieghemiana]|nr:MAG: hypothetical protein DHS80DRAFT_31975 [Piptocephalis tieghemiana]